MNNKARIKPRAAPVLVPVDDPVKRLALLDAWTEQPSNPPATGPAAAPEVQAVAEQAQATTPEPKKPAKPVKPWEGEGALAPHPYHVVISEGMYQKIDFIWKRAGYKSFKEWVLHALDAQSTKELKSMGEL